LVVDEVLAVGDAEFQKKAIGKMQDISNTSGRTVLFVSHNMAAVKNLCTRSIVMEHGKTVFDGGTNEAITFYLSRNNMMIGVDLLDISDRSGNGLVKFSKFHIEDNENNRLESVLNGDSVIFCFEILIDYSLNKEIDVDLGFSIHTEQDELMAVLYSSYQNENFKVSSSGLYNIKCSLNELYLNQGEYIIKGRILCDKTESDWPKLPIGSMRVIKGNFYKTGNLGFEGKSKVLIKGQWDLN
jgi:lipopolysaccharide transport system ATP-binding protein